MRSAISSKAHFFPVRFEHLAHATLNNLPRPDILQGIDDDGGTLGKLWRCELVRPVA